MSKYLRFGRVQLMKIKADGMARRGIRRIYLTLSGCATQHAKPIWPSTAEPKVTKVSHLKYQKQCMKVC